MSTRAAIVDAIKPLLPEDWTVVPYSDEPNVLDKPLVMVTLSDFEPGMLANTILATHHVYVLIPQQGNVEGTEDAIDDNVGLTLVALLRMRAAQQGSASRVTFQGGHPCWDITLILEATIDQLGD